MTCEKGASADEGTQHESAHLTVAGGFEKGADEAHHEGAQHESARLIVAAGFEKGVDEGTQHESARCGFKPKNCKNQSEVDAAGRSIYLATQLQQKYEL